VADQLLENEATTLPNLTTRMSLLSVIILIAAPPLSLIRKISFVVIHQDIILWYYRISQIDSSTLLNLFIKYHLTCQALILKPAGGWFCDDECKWNAGFTVRK